MHLNCTSRSLNIRSYTQQHQKVVTSRRQISYREMIDSSEYNLLCGAARRCLPTLSLSLSPVTGTCKWNVFTPDWLSSTRSSSFNEVTSFTSFCLLALSCDSFSRELIAPPRQGLRHDSSHFLRDQGSKLLPKIWRRINLFGRQLRLFFSILWAVFSNAPCFSRLP